MSSAEIPQSLSELAGAADPNEQVHVTASSSHVPVRGPMVSAHGSGGLQISMRDPARPSVWQLLEPLQRRTTGGVKDDVPSAEAAPVWLFGASQAESENRYADAGQYSRTAIVYHTTAFTGLERNQVVALVNDEHGDLAIPRYGQGDRVFAAMNNQSGRWEIVAPSEDTWRFELKTALETNGNPNVPSTADAYLVVYDAQRSEHVTTGVEFQVADFLDLWDAPVGARGYAKRLADSQTNVGWEVIAIQTTVP